MCLLKVISHCCTQSKIFLIRAGGLRVAEGHDGAHYVNHSISVTVWAGTSWVLFVTSTVIKRMGLPFRFIALLELLLFSRLKVCKTHLFCGWNGHGIRMYAVTSSAYWWIRCGIVSPLPWKVSPHRISDRKQKYGGNAVVAPVSTWRWCTDD